MPASLRDYRLLEARHASWRVPALTAAVGVALVVLTHLLFVRMPRQVIVFMERAFQLRDMGGVLLANDYLAVYLIVFFVGVVGMLGVVVTAREEHQLELLLSKPVRAAQFLAARTWPVLASTAGVGLVMALTCAIAIQPYTGPGASVSSRGAFGASLMLAALALVLLSLLNVFFLWVRDGFHALLIAFVAWFLPMLPTATYLYRPDLFEGRELLLATVMVNLVWYDATLAWLGPLAFGGSLVSAALFLWLGGVVLERTDVR
jgi:hypothetical protein